jgi:hypothetical protein
MFRKRPKYKSATSGTLKGAYVKPLDNVELPPSDLKPTKVYKVKVPKSVKPGGQFNYKLDEEKVVLTLPVTFDHMKMTVYSHTVRGTLDEVVCSTLPSVPGYEIVVSKPIVYGCVASTFVDSPYSGKPTLSSHVSKMIQQAQDQITSLAIEHNCNAVLGAHFSVSNDTSSADINRVVVSCFGTPCVIMPVSATSFPSPQLDKRRTLLYGDGLINTSQRSLYTSGTTSNLYDDDSLMSVDKATNGTMEDNDEFVL